MNTKKFLTLLLAFLMILCLAGCAEKEPPVKECEHSWGEAQTVVEPTYQCEGTAQYTCSLCGETKTEPIAKKEVPAINVPEDYDMEYVVKVNRQANVTTVYTKDDNGDYRVPVQAFYCSCGGEHTPLGEYYLGVRWPWATLIQHMYGQYTTRIVGSILFHSVPYNKKYDPSTLVPGEYNKLGSTASHGCVRLTYEAAKWIYENCTKGTLCIIYDDAEAGPMEPTPVLKIREDCGWDPTDLDPKNPWLKDPNYMLLQDESNQQ